MPNSNVNFRQHIWLAVSSLLCLIPVARADADISLPKIFSDHMILQREKPTRVWGMAQPGEKLTVTLGKFSSSAAADAKGRWSTLIRTGPAGGPYQLEVASDENDTKVVFNNVMVGEVWICGGEANMESPVSQALNPDTEIDLAKEFSNIRLFTVEHHSITSPQSDFNKVQPWTCCSPETVKDFSATAYFFGRELSKRLKVPIGLINTSWEGTPLEAWTPEDALKESRQFQQLLDHWKENEELSDPNRIANVFHGMLSPLTGYSFRGCIWYQGENNVGRGAQYSRMLPVFVRSLRQELGQGDFPFYFVQLAPFRYQGKSIEALPELWDAQLKTLLSVKNTGMVVTTDIGDPAEIRPRNKQEVSRRLSLWALSNVYPNDTDKHSDGSTPKNLPTENALNGQSPDDSSNIKEAENTRPQTAEPESVKTSKFNDSCCGPIPEAIIFDSQSVTIVFDCVGEGLNSVNDEQLSFFSICGNDQKFIAAKAEIVDRQTVRVTANNVVYPVAVRFAWSDTAKPNLFNSNGLPASPFRSDNFKLNSAGVEY